MIEDASSNFPIPRGILQLIGAHNVEDLFGDENDSSDTDAELVDCEPKPIKRFDRSFSESPKSIREKELTNYLSIFRRFFKREKRRASLKGRKIEKSLVAASKAVSRVTTPISYKTNSNLRRSNRILEKNNRMPRVKSSNLPSSQVDMFSLESPKKQMTKSPISKKKIGKTSSSSSDEDELIPGTQNVTPGHFTLSSPLIVNASKEQKRLSPSTNSTTEESDDGEKTIQFNLTVNQEDPVIKDERTKGVDSDSTKTSKDETTGSQSSSDSEVSQNQSTVGNSQEIQKTTSSHTHSHKEPSCVLGSQKIFTPSPLKTIIEPKLSSMEMDVPRKRTPTEDPRRARKRKASSDESDDSSSGKPKSKSLKLDNKECSSESSDDSRDNIYSRATTPNSEADVKCPGSKESTPKPDLAGDEGPVASHHLTIQTIQNQVPSHKRHSISSSSDSSSEEEREPEKKRDVNNIAEVSPPTKDTCHPFNSTAFPEAADCPFPGNDISVIRRMSEIPVDSPIAKPVVPSPKPSNQRSILEFAKPKAPVISNNANPEASTQDLLKNGYIDLKERFNFESSEGLFEEDLSEDVEVYIVQCPKEVDPSALIGEKIDLRSKESVMKLTCHGKPVPFDVYCDLSHSSCSVSVVTPSRKKKKFTLNTLPVKGQVTVANAVEIPDVDEVINSIDCQNPLLGNTDYISESGNELETPSKKKVKIKKENHKGEEHLPNVDEILVKEKKWKKGFEENSSHIEDTPDILNTPSKKKGRENQKNLSSELDHNQTTEKLETPSKKKAKPPRSPENVSPAIPPEKSADTNETPSKKAVWTKECRSDEELFDRETADELESPKQTSTKEDNEEHLVIEDKANTLETSSKGKLKSNEEYPSNQKQDSYQLETPSKKKKKAKKTEYDNEENLSRFKEETSDELLTPSKKKTKAKKGGHDSVDHLSSQSIQETSDVFATPSTKKTKKKKRNSEETIPLDTEIAEALNISPKKKKKKRATKEHDDSEEYHSQLEQQSADVQETPSKKKSKIKKENRDNEEELAHLSLASDTPELLVKKKKKKKKHLEDETYSLLYQSTEDISGVSAKGKTKKRKRDDESGETQMDIDFERSEEDPSPKKKKKKKYQVEIETIAEAVEPEVTHKKKKKKKKESPRDED